MTGFRSGAGQFRPQTTVGVPSVRDSRFFENGVNRARRNFAGAYSPYLWAYPFLGGYGLDYPLPCIEDRATDNTTIVQPSPPLTYPAPPPAPAQAVINEYKWNEPAGAGGDGSNTFTIALKDGSKRYSTAVWVQDGTLHYVDSEGRQQVLSSGLIDRNATERLNGRHNLRLQLPPG